ncbi:MAG: hypothetical protein EOO24_50345 [Comamonadaceae bacterium]|nr:MAG: hypothetical protein EOO24_50345 [Comamonadaceae bacterium]
MATSWRPGTPPLSPCPTHGWTARLSMQQMCDDAWRWQRAAAQPWAGQGESGGVPGRHDVAMV